MYVRVTVEVWQTGKEHGKGKTSVTLPESAIAELANKVHEKYGRAVYTSMLNSDDASLYLLFPMTAAYLRYLKANPES